MNTRNAKKTLEEKDRKFAENLHLMLDNYIWFPYDCQTCGEKFQLMDEIEPHLNPILTGGGHYGPYDQRSSAVSLWIALGSPNFLTLFLLTFYKSQKSRF